MLDKILRKLLMDLRFIFGLEKWKRERERGREREREGERGSEKRGRRAEKTVKQERGKGGREIFDF